MGDNINAQVIVATMLIQLGVTTVEKVRGFFAGEGHDDEALATIMADVDQRLARRG